MKKLTKKQRLQREVKYIAGIVLGAIFFAIGYSWFLMPYNMAPGGVAGIAQVINIYLGVPRGVAMIMLNIPLFIIGFIFIGKAFGAKSVMGMLISSSFTDLLSIQSLSRLGIMDATKYSFVFQNRPITAFLGPNDIMLSAIAGSVFLGIGLGLIFRSRASTGGTDIPVGLIKQKSGISIGSG